MQPSTGPLDDIQAESHIYLRVFVTDHGPPRTIGPACVLCPDNNFRSK